METWKAIPDYVKMLLAALATAAGLLLWVYGSGIERGTEQTTVRQIKARLDDLSGQIQPFVTLATRIAEQTANHERRINRLEDWRDHTDLRRRGSAMLTATPPAPPTGE